MHYHATHGGPLRARHVIVLLAILPTLLWVRPSAAAPFAFVANTTANTVSGAF